MAAVLIIDDDEGVSYTLSRIVDELGHRSVAAFSLKDGLKEAASGKFDVVFLDVRLPDGNGLGIIPGIQAVDFPPEIIIITAYGDVGGAELALKSGVWDYIQKPSKINEMKLPLVRALEYRTQKKEKNKPIAIDRAGIVGSSPGLLSCIDRMAQAAASDANVLITGETGTGKELFAKGVHVNSKRAHKHFIVVDCAALPENLVESTLFGHGKGAFTGADKVREGLIRQADGGTLFLDEVGELPLHLQKTFLRVLQEHRFRPVGREKEIKSDFRLVAATNRDLDRMEKKGLFRSDLLHRIRAVVIELPPLNQRRRDIKELILHHMARLCEQYEIGPKGFSPECLDALSAYDWPGNVRELVNTLESAVTSAVDEPTLFPNHLPTHIRLHMKFASLNKSANAAVGPGGPLNTLPEFRQMLEDAKKMYFEDLMAQTGGNMKKACRTSGLSRTSLYDYLKKYGLSAPG